MDPATVVAAACLIAAPLGLGWEELCRRNDTLRAKRRMCDHEWGEIKLVKNSRPPAWFRNCIRCGTQMNTNEDGTLYVPKRER